MHRWSIITIIMLQFLYCCFRLKRNVQEPVRKSKSQDVSQPSAIDIPSDPASVGIKESGAPSSSASPNVVVGSSAPTLPGAGGGADLAAEACLPLTPMTSVPSRLAADAHVMVTKVLKTCSRVDGTMGYRPDSQWIAMGFPCTAGGGEVSVKGHSHDPKFVAYRAGISCPTDPKDMNAVVELAKKYGLFVGGKLLAYTPMEVMYWEMEQYPDSGVGSTIELRTDETIKKVWQAYIDKQPVLVRFYGRESSWSRSDNWFEVVGNIVNTTPRRFKIETQAARALTAAEVEQLKQRCLALEPKRDCGSVFY